MGEKNCKGLRFNRYYLPRQRASPKTMTSVIIAKIIPKGLNIEQKRGPVFDRHHVLKLPRNTEEITAFI